MSGGRPTKYNDDVLLKTRDYIDNFSNYGDLIPSIEGLAAELKLGARTLHDWKHQEGKEEFSRMLGELLSKQARIAMNGALGGDYNATIAKLLLTKHGYSDRVEQQSENTHTINAPDLTIKVVKQMVEIPEAFTGVLDPYRYKVFYGGRGGAKSWVFARILLMKSIEKPLRILCTREFQQSIQESVLKLLADQIDLLGYQDQFEVQRTTIYGSNGSQFIFEGLKNNVTKIKSMEGIDIVWCEEAESISEQSWDVLIPTIRKPNSEIWVSFNPNDEMDNTYQRFVINPPSDSLVQKVGWKDNPWFPEELKREMIDCKQNHPKKWLHIWEGECASDYGDSIIQPEWVDASIDAHVKLGFEGLGLRVLGFDPADEGTDNKAQAVRHGSIVEDVTQWEHGDLNDAIVQVFNYAFENRIDDIVYDSVGVGAGIKVGLNERIAGRNIRVTGFGGAESPRDKNDFYEGDLKNKQLFRNLRAQYWWYLRDRFEKTYRAVEKGEYIAPDELISLSSSIADLGQLKSELCRVQRKRGTMNSLILLESKPEMLKRGVRSPNMADALVMAFANPPPKAELKPVTIHKRKWK